MADNWRSAFKHYREITPRSLNSQALDYVETLEKMLVEADSLLSLTLYRGEGRDDPTWNKETYNLLGRIRRTTKEGEDD